MKITIDIPEDMVERMRKDAELCDGNGERCSVCSCGLGYSPTNWVFDALCLKNYLHTIQEN